MHLSDSPERPSAELDAEVGSFKAEDTPMIAISFRRRFLRVGLSTAFIFALSGCKAVRTVTGSSQFRVEPEYHKTFGPTRELARGELITLKVTAIGEHQRVRLHVCTVKPCTRARTVTIWPKSSFAATDTASIAVAEAGEYYLWVDDVARNPDGTSVDPVKWSDDGKFLVVEYASGLKVAARVGGV